MMEAHPVESGAWRPRVMAVEQMQLVRMVLLTAAGLLLALSCVFLVRRLVGALAQPLAPAPMIAFAATTAALAAMVRCGWRAVCRHAPASGSVGGRVLDATLSAGVLCLAVSWSVPGSSAWALAASWGIVGAGELLGWWPPARRLVRRSRARGASAAESIATMPATGVAQGTSSVGVRRPYADQALDEPVEDEDFALLPPGVTQRITRATDEQGDEVVYGIVRCDFAAGQKQQHVHVAFCPPLEQTPELTTDQMDGPIVRIKASIVETFGAGLEVKLPAPHDEPTSVQLQFYALAKASRGARV